MSLSPEPWKQFGGGLIQDLKYTSLGLGMSSQPAVGNPYTGCC